MTTIFPANMEPAQVVQTVLMVLEAYHNVQLQRLEKIRFDLRTALQADQLSSLEKYWLHLRDDHSDDQKALSAFTSAIVQKMEQSA